MVNLTTTRAYKSSVFSQVRKYLFFKTICANSNKRYFVYFVIARLLGALYFLDFHDYLLTVVLNPLPLFPAASRCPTNERGDSISTTLQYNQTRSIFYFNGGGACRNNCFCSTPQMKNVIGRERKK